MTENTERSSFSTLLRSASAASETRTRTSDRRAVSGRLDPGWKLALWLLITLRVGFALAGLLSIRFHPINYVDGNWLHLIVPGNDSSHLLFSMWQRWDALWYQQIATNGYRANNSTLAFYPLYPLLSRLTSFLFNRQIIVAELSVSSVAFTVGMWLFYKVARLDVGPFAARLAILLTVFFPVGFYFLAPFTESLYLVLSLAAFWFARNGRPWAAGLAGFAAGLTRIQGLFLVWPLAYEFLHRRRQEGRLLSLDSLGMAAAALPGLGVLSVMIYDRVIVGMRGSPLSTEAFWGYGIVAPWKAISDSMAHIASRGDVVEALNLASLLGFGLLALWVARKLPLAYSLYVFPYLALLYTHDEYFSPLMSISRYMLVLFPCFIVLANWLVRRPWLAAGVLVTSLLVQITLFQFWIHFGFVA